MVQGKARQGWGNSTSKLTPHSYRQMLGDAVFTLSPSSTHSYARLKRAHIQGDESHRVFEALEACRNTRV